MMNRCVYPHKRNHRLKDHSELIDMQSDNPDSENIFKDNLYSTYYPTDELEDVCLYDFVGERAKRARHSQVCSIENRIYIYIYYYGTCKILFL